MRGALIPPFQRKLGFLTVRSDFAAPDPGFRWGDEVADRTAA